MISVVQYFKYVFQAGECAINVISIALEIITYNYMTYNSKLCFLPFVLLSP